MALQTGDITNTINLGPKQWVRSNAAGTAFEPCTIYDQPDWNQTDSTALDYIKNKPSIGGSRTFNSPSRTVNTAFQVSTTQDAAVSYTVDITTSLTLTGGAAGTVYLEYADNSGFTTNVKEVAHFTTSNTGTLVVGVTLNQVATAQVSGVVPAGKYVRLRTANTTGTPTYGTPVSQEVLL